MEYWRRAEQEGWPGQEGEKIFTFRYLLAETLRRLGHCGEAARRFRALRGEPKLPGTLSKLVNDGMALCAEERR